MAAKLEKPKNYNAVYSNNAAWAGTNTDAGVAAGGRSGYDITNPGYNAFTHQNAAYQTNRWDAYDSLMSNPDIDAISRDELLQNFKTRSDGSFLSSGYSGTLSNSGIAAGIAKAAEGKGLYGIRKRLQAYNEVIAANPGRGATVTSIRPGQAGPSRTTDPLVA